MVWRGIKSSIFYIFMMSLCFLLSVCFQRQTIVFKNIFYLILWCKIFFVYSIEYNKCMHL